MSRTRTITLATQDYAVEAAAQAQLQKYHSAIKGSMGSDEDDMMSDIELRITELLAKQGIQPGDTITTAAVQTVITQLGTPEDLADVQGTPNSDKPHRKPKISFAKIALLLVGISAILAIGLLGYASYQNRHTQSETNSFTHHNEITNLELDIIEGSITVQANDDPKDMSTTISRQSIWATTRPRIVEEWKGTTLKIDTAHCPTFGFISTPLNCVTNFHISAPQNMTTKLKTGSGDITLKLLHGNQTISTDSGTITIADVQAEDLMATVSSGKINILNSQAKHVSATIDSGSIIAHMLNAPVVTRAHASSGNINLTLPGKVAYKVLTTSDSGKRDIQVDQSQQSLNVIDVSTDSGSVTIQKSSP